MRKLGSSFIKQRVEYILSKVRVNAPPVNLVPIAKIQRVRRIELQPMLIGGCVEPVDGGFKIYIRDRSSRSLCIDDEPDLDSLKPRQRFTLAHEIAHTFFYDLASNPPRVSKQSPKSEIIEWLCQQAASRLLLPDHLLKQHLNKGRALDLRLAVELGKRFKASTEAVIRRINEMDNIKSPYRALLLAKRDLSGRDAQIKAMCFHPSLLPFLSRPQLYSNLTDWSHIFREEEFWTEDVWDYQSKQELGTLLIRKRTYFTSKDTFFLEIELNPAH